MLKTERLLETVFLLIYIVHHNTLLPTTLPLPPPLF